MNKEKLSQLMAEIESHVTKMATLSGNICQGAAASSSISYLERKGIESLYSEINGEYGRYIEKINFLHSLVSEL